MEQEIVLSVANVSQNQQILKGKSDDPVAELSSSSSMGDPDDNQEENSNLRSKIRDN